MTSSSDTMVEGLKVTIKYRGAKHDQVAAPATASSEFAILKKDLAHLRVHSPSQRNVRRVDGSFILHWPSAGTSPNVVGLADSLHTRWFKLCSDDPEALKLRDFLSIESITMVQDGDLIRSTAGATVQVSQDAPPGTLTERFGGTLPETAQQPVVVSAPTPSLPAPPLVIPPPRVPPTAPRIDRDRQQPPHLKRRMSNDEGSPSQTRQKLDVTEVSTTSPVQPITSEPQPTQSLTSLRADREQSPAPITEDPPKAPPQPMQEVKDDTTVAPPPVQVHKSTTPKPPEAPVVDHSPSREPGEMTPNRIPTPAVGPGPSPSARPPFSNHRTLSPHGPRPASPYGGSLSSPNGDLRRRDRDRDRDVSRLTRELWDTRRQLTALQAREQAIMNDLESLGARPEGSSTDRTGVSRDELMRLEADMRVERARRMRAERVLSDVERECRTPFVVPALFQAFMSISELSD